MSVNLPPSNASNPPTTLNPAPAIAIDQQKLSSAIASAISTIQQLADKIQRFTLHLFSFLHEKISSSELPPLIAKSYEIATEIEKGFNIAACLPIVGTACSSIRAIAGELQLVAAAITMLVGKAGFLISKHYQIENKTLEKWREISSLGAEHVIHGCLNFIRGSGEALLGSLTFGIGNVVLLVPNLRQDEPFAPAFPYGSITLK